MEKIKVTFILKGHLMWYPSDKKKIHHISVDKNSKIIDGLAKLEVPTEQINIILKNKKK